MSIAVIGLMRSIRNIGGALIVCVIDYCATYILIDRLSIFASFHAYDSSSRLYFLRLHSAVGTHTRANVNKHILFIFTSVEFHC